MSSLSAMTMTLDFEDFMLDVHQEIEGICEEEGYELSSEDMDALMVHFFDNGMDYTHLGCYDCAEKLLEDFKNYTLEPLDSRSHLRPPLS